MKEKFDWTAVWKTLRVNLENQPKYSEDSEYPCVWTLARPSPNDIIEISEEQIVVRSHNPKKGIPNNNPIQEKTFKIWWEYLQQYEIASANTNSPNYPPGGGRSSIVAAIFVCCLPDKVKHKQSNTIEIVR